MAKKKSTGARKTTSIETGPCNQIPPEVLEWLKDEGLEVQQGSSILVVREVSKPKPSRARATARSRTRKR